MASAAVPMPPPPALQAEPQPGAGLMDRMNQLQQNQSQGAASSLQALQQAVSKIAQSTSEAGRIISIMHPQLMGHIEKMVEIGKALDKDVTEITQRQQAQAGSQVGQPPAPGPTEGGGAM